MARTALFLLAIVCFAVVADAQCPAEVVLGGFFPLTGRLAGGGVEREAASRVAVGNINADPTLMPQSVMTMITFNTNTTQTGGLSSLLEAVEVPTLGIVGAASSSVSNIIAIASGVFLMPQISYSSTASSLSDDTSFPFFNRMVPPDSKQGAALASLVALYNWRPYVAAISTADEYGVGGISEFIDAGELLRIEVNTYQQFLTGSEEDDIDVEMRELRNSEARVFVAFMLAGDARTMFSRVEDFDIVGDQYVWFCSDGCAQTSVFTEGEEILADVRSATRGLIGFTPSGGTGELFEEFLDQWETLDPNEFAGAGDRTINLFAPHAYDCFYTYAHAFTQLCEEQPNNITAFTINTAVRKQAFVGLTGDIQFENNGDRIALYNVVNLRDRDETFTNVGTWDTVRTDDFGFDFDTRIQFFDGTTNVPDLDVRTPFDYWSCHNKEKRSDPTGKTISLSTPDGDDPNNISSHYICDQFIDCDNMSDEGFDCAPSYVATFIAFGILTGLLVLTLPIFVIFAIVFGIILKRKRVRVQSPIFLLGMCLAAFIGYCSTYSWYGKPHPVACFFQPWLLGVAVNLLVASLAAKTFRIWRIFKSPMKRKRISDLSLMVLVLILMIPCIFILTVWSIVSTPTAKIVDVDGDDHYVCETGGFTGPPGGYVFFGVLVAYEGIVLLFGVFLAFVTRNVPDEYSESRLVGISVYNLAFLSIVVIPVFLVLRDISPVAAWIIRTIATLYGFTATLWLQFIPTMGLLIVKDKCGDRNTQLKDSKDLTASASASASMAG